MSSERIFNIFIFFEAGVAREYGMRHHRRDGADSHKLEFLKEKVAEDSKMARRFPLPQAYTLGEWSALQRVDNPIRLFEVGFSTYNATHSPIYCITMVADGEPRADASIDGINQGANINVGEHSVIEDWLVKYQDGNHFHFDKLIHDDYFVAIKLLFNAGHIASTAKLLMSCIDTLAFVEYGDRDKNFTDWLQAYVELDPLGVTARELWEFRNSVLHMTNLSSRQVLKGNVAQLVPYIGSDELAALSRAQGAKPFNLYRLLLATGKGIGKWAESYNVEPNKWLKFIERYDTLISDSRQGKIVVDSSAVSGLAN